MSEAVISLEVPAMTPDQQASMLTLSQQAAPEEACGLVFSSGDCIGLPNRASNRCTHFEIWPDDVLTFLRSHGLLLDEVRAVWHSHPISTSLPSPDDRGVMERTQLPMFIVGVTTRIIACYAIDAQRQLLALARYEVHR